MKQILLSSSKSISSAPRTSSNFRTLEDMGEPRTTIRAAGFDLLSFSIPGLVLVRHGDGDDDREEGRPVTIRIRHLRRDLPNQCDQKF